MISFVLEIIMQLQMPYGRPIDAMDGKVDDRIWGITFLRCAIIHDNVNKYCACIGKVAM